MFDSRNIYKDRTFILSTLCAHCLLFCCPIAPLSWKTYLSIHCMFGSIHMNELWNDVSGVLLWLFSDALLTLQSMVKVEAAQIAEHHGELPTSPPQPADSGMPSVSGFFSSPQPAAINLGQSLLSVPAKICSDRIFLYVAGHLHFTFYYRFMFIQIHVLLAVTVTMWIWSL